MYNTENPYKSAGEYLKAPLFEKYQLRRAAVKTSTALFPFMLFAVRVKKFGMVTIMAVLSGLLMGLTGMGFWGILTGAVFGLLGDLIMKSGSYGFETNT